MKKLFRLSAFLLLCSSMSVNAFNHTTDVNGWGYTEIRQRSLLPILVPMGAVAIAGAIAFIVDQCNSNTSEHSHQY